MNRTDDKDALAAQAVPAQPVAWQPIETAPRGSGEDGPRDTRHPDYEQPPRLLLWTEEGIIVGYYDWYYHAGYGRGAEPGVSAWRDVGGDPAYGPTHWMPLPPPPQAAQPVADTQSRPNRRSEPCSPLT